MGDYEARKTLQELISAATKLPRDHVATAEGGAGSGAAITLDGGVMKGIKGVVSKEHERKDAAKFSGVSRDAVKKALAGPRATSPHFPPPEPPADPDDLRKKRLARFGA